MALASVLAQAGPGLCFVQGICPSLWEQASFITWWLSLSHRECDHTSIHVLMHVYVHVSITVIHMYTHVRMVSHQTFSSSINF